jgi:hypothetical protein
MVEFDWQFGEDNSWCEWYAELGDICATITYAGSENHGIRGEFLVEVWPNRSPDFMFRDKANTFKQARQLASTLTEQLLRQYKDKFNLVDYRYK